MLWAERDSAPPAVRQTPKRKFFLAQEAVQHAGRAPCLVVARPIRPQLRQRMKPAEREVWPAVTTEYHAARANFS